MRSGGRADNNKCAVRLVCANFINAHGCSLIEFVEDIDFFEWKIQ